MMAFSQNRAQFPASTLFILVVAALGVLSGCSDAGSSAATDGGTTIPASDGSVYDASRPDTGVGFDVVVAPPVFTDWVCPEGWVAAPGFTDENGVENPPEGVKQFSICRPPENWAPVQMKDWACRAGWHRKPGFTDGNGVENPPEGVSQFSICEPPEVPECQDGEVAYLGETSCHTIGSACPSGDFLDETDIRKLAPGHKGKILYVKAGASSGDGTKGSPYGTVASALTGAAAGDAIALSRGTFIEAVTVDKGIALVGACTRGSVVQAPTPDASAYVVTVTGDGVRIANLGITGPRRGLLLKAAADASVDAVEVLGTVNYAFMVIDASVAEIQRLVVRDTDANPGTGDGGKGFQVESGSNVTLTNAVLEANRKSGVATFDEGTLLLLNDVVIRRTRGRTMDGNVGWGMGVMDGSVVKAAGLLIDGNMDVGVHAGIRSLGYNAPALDLEDCVIRDTVESEATGTRGIGAELADGTRGVFTRVLFAGNKATGISAYPGFTTPPYVTLTDVVIRDTKGSDAEQYSGYGIYIEDTVLEMDRALLARNRCIALSADKSDAAINLSNVAVLDTASGADGIGGRGLDVSGGAQVKGRALLLQRNRDHGIIASGKGTLVELSAVVVRDTEGQELDGKEGRGAQAQSGASVTLSTAVVERSREGGIIVSSDDTGVARMDLNDVVVRDTIPEQTSISLGRGIFVQTNSVLTGQRLLIEGNTDIGIFVAKDPGPAPTEVHLTDVLIRDTRPNHMTSEDGDGLIVQDGTLAKLDRIVVDRNRLSGIGLYSEGTVCTLVDSVIRSTQEMASDGSFGYGLSVNSGASLTASRVVIDRNISAGVLAGSPPGEADVELILNDIQVRDTVSSPNGKIWGWGLGAQDGAQITIERGMFNGNREAAIAAISADTTRPPKVTLHYVTIAGTLTADCALIPEGEPDSCIVGEARGGSGTGISAMAGVVTVDHFSIESSELCGIQVARQGSVIADHGEIKRNAIGVNIQIDGYDSTTILSPTVRVHDNDTNVDTRDLPVPDPLDATKGIDSSGQ